MTTRQLVGLRRVTPCTPRVIPVSRAVQTAPMTVFDIDGVLADVSHRLHHLEGPDKDWDGFFDAAVDDRVLVDGLSRVRQMVELGKSCVYLSGRPERTRTITVEWFQRHDFPALDLYLRPDMDRRPARLFKPSVLERLGGPSGIEMVFDDDDAVVEQLQVLGYAVTHVLWGKSSAQDQGVLDQAQERLGRT